MKVAHIRSTASFDEAFAASREEGVDLFKWKGRLYTVERADDPVPEEPVILYITSS